MESLPIAAFSVTASSFKFSLIGLCNELEGPFLISIVYLWHAFTPRANSMGRSLGKHGEIEIL